MQLEGARKIAVIGNAGGGKTTLARRLAKQLGIPLTHIDAIQFLPGLQIRPYRESIEIIKKIHQMESWLIDGFGPLDILIERLELADKVVFIDFPLWRHYWWCTKRQVQSIWKARTELPVGCDEAMWSHTVKIYRTLWKVHHQMRPELLRILARDSFRHKVIYVRSLKDWKGLCESGGRNPSHVI